MRLWHKDMIPVLPRKQLLGQWRECCAIMRNIALNGSPNHVLVNKIMDYPLKEFFYYTEAVVDEMERRGYRPDCTKFGQWWEKTGKPIPNTDKEAVKKIFKGWHNDRYFLQCWSNLQEKLDCGAITLEEFLPIETLKFRKGLVK